MLDMEELQAIAAIVSAASAAATFFVALAAAIYARNQVAEARRSREEQARPYVAAYLDIVEGGTIELVVKNFGATTARDVTLTTDRPMMRYWAGESEVLPTFAVLPVLVPGQAWSTIFDVYGARIGRDDEPYVAVVASRDSAGKRLANEEFVLDARAYADKLYVSRRTLHDVGEAVVKMEQHMARWGEFGSGLSVVTRDGAEKDRRDRERVDGIRAARAARDARARASGTDVRRDQTDSAQLGSLDAD